jgi:hypothetical protein
MQIEIILYLSTFQVIKSARVMKKAVAHLIPFMEEEREARFAALGETMVDAVSCAPGSGSDPELQLGRSGSGVIIPHPDLIIPCMEEEREARFAALGETMVD